mmetsp:Transcript_34439/g.78277  ORF Transcript_34439/g.78277 Transcript_34439/m.78277 type:complete len:853 (+) Transcript_34439:332-2890(+)
MLLPLAFVRRSACIDVLALPAPLPLVPLALVAGAVRRLEDAVAVRLPVDEVALVALAVCALQEVLLLRGERRDGGLGTTPGLLRGSNDLNPRLVREDAVEPVFDLLRGQRAVLLEELLPLPILPGGRLVLLVQGPIPHGERVHEPSLHDLVLDALQHDGSLLVAVPQHGLYQGLLRGLVGLRSLHLLVLSVQEDRVLASVVLTPSSADELDPLSLAPRDEGQDQQEPAFLVDCGIHYSVVVTSAALCGGHGDAPDLPGGAAALLVTLGHRLGGLVDELNELLGVPWVVQELDDVGVAGASLLALLAAFTGRRLAVELNQPVTELLGKTPHCLGVLGDDKDRHLGALGHCQLDDGGVLRDLRGQGVHLADVHGDLLALDGLPVGSARVEEVRDVEADSLVVLPQVLLLRTLAQGTGQTEEARVGHEALQAGQDRLLVLVLDPLSWMVLLALEDLQPQAPILLSDHLGLRVQQVHAVATPRVVDALLLVLGFVEGLFDLLLEGVSPLVHRAEVVPVSLDLAMHHQLGQPFVDPIAEFAISEPLAGGGPSVEDQAVNLVDNEHRILQPTLVLVRAAVHETVEATTLHVVTCAIDDEALLVLQVLRVGARLNPEEVEDLAVAPVVALGQDTVVVDHVRPHALLCNEGREHADDQRLALARANPRQHGLGEIVRGLLPGPACADREHEQGYHLRVVGQHDHTVPLLHGLGGSTGYLQDDVPIRGLEGDAPPDRWALEHRGLLLDGRAYVHILRRRQRLRVDLLDACNQVRELIVLGALALMLKPLECKLQVLLAHVLEEEDHGVQGPDRAYPSSGRRLVEEGVDDLLDIGLQGLGDAARQLVLQQAACLAHLFGALR